MKINKQLLTPNRFSRPQTPLKEVKKVAIHYVANPMSTAQNNRDYFNNLRVGVRNKFGKLMFVSAHYVVGLQGEIINCIPENEISYCTNSANTYSISIETCHPTADGHFNAATYKSLVELTADICERYKLNPLTDVIRHYDVTGKACPLWYVSHPDEWEQFKRDVAKFIQGEQLPDKNVLYRVQVGSFRKLQYAENYLNEVQKDYPDSFIQRDCVNGQVCYRVQVGAFSKRKYAENYLREVKKDYPQSFIQKMMV